jgi:hypothetical protein
VVADAAQTITAGRELQVQQDQQGLAELLVQLELQVQPESAELLEFLVAPELLEW